MNVTLRQFRYFVSVADFASVSSAARHLHISQSAITTAIHELEEELGAQLFERNSRGVALTPEGHRFLAGARRVMATVTDATQDLRADHRTLTGQLTIGVTPLVAGYYLSELLVRFARMFPDVEVTVTEDEARFLEHLLINGEVDISIIIVSELVDRQAFATEILARSTRRVWLPANHPLTARDEVSLAEIAPCPNVVLTADRMDEHMRALWRRHDLLPSTLLRTSSLEAVRSLVGAGMGVTILPDFVFRPWSLEAERIEARSLRDELPTIDIGLVWRRGLAIRPAVQEFIHVAREQSIVRQRRAPP